ncbi:MAG: hypothetical protein ACOX87_07645 [Chloroflexota bacterium]|jgi:hypothetical protein
MAGLLQVRHEEQEHLVKIANHLDEDVCRALVARLRCRFDRWARRRTKLSVALG